MTDSLNLELKIENSSLVVILTDGDDRGDWEVTRAEMPLSELKAAIDLDSTHVKENDK